MLKFFGRLAGVLLLFNEKINLKFGVNIAQKVLSGKRLFCRNIELGEKCEKCENLLFLPRKKRFCGRFLRSGRKIKCLLSSFMNKYLQILFSIS